MEPSPWVSLMLYAVLLNALVLLAGSYASLAGNTKIYPRIFFGVFATGIPLFLFLNISYYLVGVRLYRRVMWDMGVLVCTLGLAVLLCGVLGMRHVRLHGNDAGAMPFEVPGDLGTTFTTAHFAVFSTSLFVSAAGARAILGYSLDAYPLQKRKIS